ASPGLIDEFLVGVPACPCGGENGVALLRKLPYLQEVLPMGGHRAGIDQCDAGYDVLAQGSWHSELEFRYGGAAKWLDHGIEEAHGVEACRAGARNATGRHDGQLADHHNEAAADAKLIFERVGDHGHRTGDEYGVVFSRPPARVRVTRLD